MCYSPYMGPPMPPEAYLTSEKQNIAPSVQMPQEAIRNHYPSMDHLPKEDDFLESTVKGAFWGRMFGWW